MNSDIQRKIEANRARALERLRATKNNAGGGGSLARVEKSRPTIQLTAEQKAQIERNRQKALAKQQYLQENLRDASHNTRRGAESARLPKEQIGGANANRPLDNIRASVKKSDYIDYDFATMKDSYGGFISDDPHLKQRDEMSLEQWKEEQKKKLVDEPLPPADISLMPKCFECGSIDIDHQLLTVFGCRVCKSCKELKAEKYSLLTKTECREDYFLTDPELRDENLFKRLEKPNPYSGTYSRMQLFLRYQIEEYAFKKWGGESGLDKEWQNREEQRVKRRDKKFELKLKEMRKKTRAEEYTRKLKRFDDDHTHEWSAPIQIKGEDEGMVRKRCMGCGMEVEQFLI